MDISEIKNPDDTASLSLEHPYTGETLLNADDTPMTVEVYGKDSDHYKKLTRKLQNAKLKQAAEKGTKLKTPTVEQIEKDAIDLLSNCVKSWNITLGGECPACDTKTVSGILSQYPWMKDQIDLFLHNRENFLKV